MYINQQPVGPAGLKQLRAFFRTLGEQQIHAGLLIEKTLHHGTIKWGFIAHWHRIGRSQAHRPIRHERLKRLDTLTRLTGDAVLGRTGGGETTS